MSNLEQRRKFIFQGVVATGGILAAGPRRLKTNTLVMANMTA